MKIQKFKKRIGLIGFGCVGQGLYDVVEANRHLGWEIGSICVKDKDKPRTLPASAFTYNVQEVLQDTSLDIIAELISDPEEALGILRQALQQGRTVVSANKKVIAENLPELIRLQQKYGGVLLYEASVCGSIPVLRTLEAYYGSEPLLEVRGILNGSSNYILSKLHAERGSYQLALEQAQALGFAEADPSLDVEGVDALHKLCILATHAYGVLVHPEEVLHFGIQHINTEVVELADALGCRIKLIGSLKATATGQVALQVLPTLIPATDALYGVEAEFNGLEIEAQFAGKQFLLGKGAGSHPTGSAVWADITSAVRGYRYTYPKLCTSQATKASGEEQITVLLQGQGRPITTFIELLQSTLHFQSPDKNQVVLSVTPQQLKLNQTSLKLQGVFVAVVPASVALDKIPDLLARSEAIPA
ncbi:homoserine dehydrogenase [Pontibacter lucknowensis]|uniref:Homoserine dehydrogenase n=1 Tax=Pontibacter lucknowensis TaxID=1077936 RepID=A0A1N6YLK2_9BACT|nr:homoserine dehydrogenase [Pontibacter lucknowensis]SIR15498.1 homoserine dehydrogenase [Pontibacter lucknowensis]